MSGEIPPEATISTRVLLRVIVSLIALWSLFSGIMLTAFHGASSGALGAGVADDAGQRLVGVHLLLLVPAYFMIAWQPERYGGMIWLPFFGQVVVISAVGYSILTSDTNFSDGILAVAVSLILGSLFGFVWISQQRIVARTRLEAELEDQDLSESAWDEEATSELEA